MRLVLRVLAAGCAASVLACATTGRHLERRSSEPPMVIKAPPPVPVPLSPDAASPSGAAIYEFSRAVGCGERTRYPGRRDVYSCQGEERMRLQLAADGRVFTTQLPMGRARGPYPVEVVSQWRYCPFQEDSALKALPDKFTAYQDPDVGQCYLYRPVDPGLRESLRGSAKLRLLEGLHPYFADSVARMVALAKSEGIDIKVISGVRPSTVRQVWVTKTLKGKGKKPRKVKVRTEVHRKTWHAWGLAVDVNLAHRSDLTTAVAAYLSDPEEHRQWTRVGEIGMALGLKWLGPHNVEEIFHFEWHPGWPGRSDDVHAELVRLRGRGQNDTVWKALSYDPARTQSFKFLRDPPGGEPGQRPTGASGTR